MSRFFLNCVKKINEYIIAKLYNRLVDKMFCGKFFWRMNFMRYENNKAVDLKIAYIGGGSRGWAWGLMSDLAQADDISL